MEIHKFVPWMFIGLGVLVLFTGGAPTEHSYEDSSGNPLSPNNSVMIIDFVFPIVFGLFFLVGGHLMLKEKHIGLYIVWAGCLMPALNEGISSILMGSYDGEHINFVGAFILIPLGFAAVAESYFRAIENDGSKSH